MFEYYVLGVCFNLYNVCFNWYILFVVVEDVYFFGIFMYIFFFSILFKNVVFMFKCWINYVWFVVRVSIILIVDYCIIGVKVVE